MWFVYILLCKDGSLRKHRFRKLCLYTGSTNNLKKRFLDHKTGKGGRCTRSHKPIKIIYSEQLPTQSSALKREAEIKSWTREQKIKNLNLSVTISL